MTVARIRPQAMLKAPVFVIWNSEIPKPTPASLPIPLALIPPNLQGRRSASCY